jgi:Transposase, Mutator family/Transposase
VQVADARKAKAVGSLAAKTDKLDARVLAELARRDLVPRVHVPTFADRELKERLGRRMHLVRLRTAAMDRAHGVLSQFGVTLAFARLREPDAEQLLADRGIPEVWRRSVAEAVAVVDETVRLTVCEPRRFSLCELHLIYQRERNVLGHLPERDQSVVRRRLRAAWALDDHDRALDQLRTLADELARSHPGAAASLTEGLEETLTVTRLGVGGRLKRTLASTNPFESMIATVRRVSRNVKHWSNGDMSLRWTAAGTLEAEQQFRRVIGYRDLAKLAITVERDVAAKRAADSPTSTAHATVATAAPEVAASHA